MALLDACSRVLGKRRPDGWTSPARTSSSNMSSRWNTRPQSHGSGSTLHSSLGSVRMLSIWSRKPGCFGMGTRWKVSGVCGTRNCTCAPNSVVELAWANSPIFLGNGYASHVAWVGVGRRGKVVVRCAAARQQSVSSECCAHCTCACI